MSEIDHPQRDSFLYGVFGLAAWDPANLICAGLIFGAGIGLYRLRASGATSLVQMILPVPIYAAMTRGKVLLALAAVILLP